MRKGSTPSRYPAGSGRQLSVAEASAPLFFRHGQASRRSNRSKTIRAHDTKRNSRDNLASKRFTIQNYVFSNSTDLLSTMAQSAASQTNDLQALLDILNQAIPNVINAEPSSFQEARMEAIRACEKMCALLHDPFQWLFVESASYIFPAAMSVVLELKVPHHISLDRENPTDIGELAVATSSSEELLGQ